MNRTKTMLWNSPLDKHRGLKSSRPFRVNSVTRRSAMSLPASPLFVDQGLDWIFRNNFLFDTELLS